MPSLFCPIFKSSKKKNKSHSRRNVRHGHHHDYNEAVDSMNSTDVLGDYSPSSVRKREGRDAGASTKQLSGGAENKNDSTKSHAALSLQNHAHSSRRDDDSSLPTVDPDYNPTSDNFSLSDAGGTIGSTSLNTSIFGSGTRATFGSNPGSNEFNSYTYNQHDYNNNNMYMEQNYYPTHQQPPPQPKQQILEIFAPAGKLGVVIDVPLNSPTPTPVVHAIKDTCPIRNRIVVGDQLLAVDDQDVRSMTAVEVSRLISKKSQQEARKLTIQRNVFNEYSHEHLYSQHQHPWQDQGESGRVVRSRSGADNGYGGVGVDSRVYDLRKFGM